MEIRCPACQTLLDVSATSCPICLRGRSREEILRAIQSDKRAREKRRRRLVASAAAALGAATVALSPGLRRTLIGAARPLARQARTRVQATLQADWPDTTPHGPPVTPQSSLDAAANPDGRPAVAAKPAPSPSAPAPAPAPAAKPAALAPTWTISGTVYFLRDAKPAAGVELWFSPTQSGAVQRARANKDGRYTLTVPALSDGAGYKIALRAKGREVSYLEEAALPYRERTRSQREDAIEEARQAPLLHAPLSPETPATTQDFAILP